MTGWIHRSMRILLTNLTLATRTGTEIVTRDLALGFAAAGHAVCVYTPQPGRLAEEMTSAGAGVVSRLEDVPFRPDIIHGHHHVETTLAALHFRGTPAVFVCHDRQAWHDSPPRLAAVRRYVAVDRNCLERLLYQSGIPAARTALIPNAVDLRRFPLRTPLPERPRRALVFSNYFRPGPVLDLIATVCRERGIELEVAGAALGALAEHPEERLAGYDLVFGKARCALEALASGCAAVVCDPHGLGPLVSSENVAELREWNFGARCLQRPWSAAALESELERWDADDADRTAAWIRGDADLSSALERYLRLYQESIADPAATEATPEEAVTLLARNQGQLEALLRASGDLTVSPPLPRQAASLVELRAESRPSRMAAGEVVEVPVTLDNRSSELLASMPPYPVYLSYRWLEAGGSVRKVADGLRTPLAPALGPRSQLSQRLAVQAPALPGRYRLQLTLVQEEQFWFDDLARPVALAWDVLVEPAGTALELSWTLRRVADAAGLSVQRDGRFANLGFLSDHLAECLVFAESRRFLQAAVAAGVAAVITTQELAPLVPEPVAVAVAADPKRSFFELHNRLAAETDFYGVSFDSVIHREARLHARCWVDPRNVVIGAGASIGPNVTILGRAQIGAGAVIHPGAVIGSAGFQTVRRPGAMLELTHAGSIEIGPGCHVLANAVIAHGVFRQVTRLGSGCRIGNGAFVSHNTVLGEDVFVGHGTVVNGNVQVGAGAWIGPNATLSNNIEIGANAQVSLGATVIRDVAPGQRVSGVFAVEHRALLRWQAGAGKDSQR